MGESMFSSVRDASKIALVHLVARLKYLGYLLLDVQYPNTHLEQFGVLEIPAKDYENLLKPAVLCTPKMFCTAISKPDILQSL